MVEGKGVVASFWLELENIGSCIFLQFGAYKLGGWSLLLVGAIESWKLQLPLNVIFYYIRKTLCGFPCKSIVHCISLLLLFIVYWTYYLIEK